MKQVTNKETPIGLSADFSAGILEATREWQVIFKVITRKNLQPIILYLARLSINQLKERSKVLQISKS